MSSKVRELRLQHNLTQQELADQLKVSRGTIVVWERDGAKISPALQIRLASFFDVQPNVFAADVSDASMDIPTLSATVHNDEHLDDYVNDPLLSICAQVRKNLHLLTLAQIKHYKAELKNLLTNLDSQEMFCYLKAYRSGSSDITEDDLRNKIELFLSSSSISSDSLLQEQLSETAHGNIS